MEHNRAVEIHAVERYLLGEMLPDERDDFEEHYFDCAECAQDVRAAARFRANVRDVLRNPGQFSPPERDRSAWWRFPTLVPLAAAFAFAGIVAYQNAVTIPALRSPQFSSTLMLDGPTRGSLPHLDEGKPVVLLTAPETPAEGQRIDAELADESGKVTKSPAIVPEPGQPLEVSFPGKFRAGRYTVLVREIPSGRVLFEDHFEIVTKENKANER